MSQRLVIIGAGPKAMAIASKVSVLREVGFQVPEVHIIEKRAVGANWTGDSGFTNGRLALGTSPEKDVGFPYQSTQWGPCLGPLIDERMARFSWQSYLIHTKAMSDWVDRGRPAPPHREWASYLQWVAAETSDSTRLHHGEVDRLALTEQGNWEIGFRTVGGNQESLEADGIMVTGPGRIPLSDRLPPHDNILTVETFWKSYQRLRDQAEGRVAIIGTGENAASIAMALTEGGSRLLEIEIVSPTGMTFSRGESFRENRVYSNPEDGHWNKLTTEDRRQFIYRTDRGVFSQHAQRVLDGAENVEIVPGRVVEVRKDGKRLGLDIAYGNEIRRETFDYVVVATGADQLSFLRSLLDGRSLDQLRGRLEVNEVDQRTLESRIGSDLSVEGLTPRLHLPMLSGISQGPGFANLSCLGRLSDRVLASYVQRR